MNRYTQCLDALEPVVLAMMPLGADLEALLQRLAAHTGIPPDELRQQAVNVAMATHGMTDDERLAHVASEPDCSPHELRSELDELLA